MSTYKDSVVLITGGASGIGRSLAEQLVAQGARVVLADVDEVQVRSVARRLGCASIPVDVRDPEAVGLAVAFAEETYGAVDVMINNAGVAVLGEAHTFEHSNWTRIIDVNLYGVVNGVHAVYPGMVARGRGQIINVASIAGLFPSAGQASYTASKYAVVGLSHALRSEAAAHGVKVNVVCPGIIHTRMRDTLSSNDDRTEKIRALLPLGGDVDACARAILEGARRNKPTIVITPMARALHLLMRVAPNLALWLQGVSFQMLLRRVGPAGTTTATPNLQRS